MTRLGLSTEEDLFLYRPIGCEQCGGSGYLGRTMIVELLAMSQTICTQVLRRAGAQEIARTAIETGMETMQQCGFKKAMAGITTIEEVVRVTREV